MTAETLFEKMARLTLAKRLGKQPMQLFNKIEGGVAIVRKPKGFLAQMELFSRGSQVYIKTGGGFIRISEKLGEAYLTIHPDYKVLELEGAGVTLDNNKAPSFSASLGWGKTT